MNKIIGLKELIGRELSLQELNKELQKIGFYNEDDAVESEEILESEVISFQEKYDEEDEAEPCNTFVEFQVISKSNVKIINIRYRESGILKQIDVGATYEDPESKWEITALLENGIEIKDILEGTTNTGRTFVVPVEEVVYFIEHPYKG